MMKVKFSVLVPVYNEAANIDNLLRSIVSQEYGVGWVDEIVVVASGCTDETEDIVGRWVKKDRRIRLLRQKKRLGKVSAVNYYLKKSRARVVVMMGGDVMLKQGCLEELVRHFKDKQVGMVGARIKSVNDGSSFFGFANQMIWQLHDQMARDYPRLGEVTAWRRVFEQLPKETICDEAEIEMLVKEKGLRLVYEPKAVGYNHGPTEWGEYISRRRSIHLGHLLIQKRWGRRVGSEKSWLVLRYWWRELIRGKRVVWLVGLVLVELIAKVLGKIDYYTYSRQVIWPVAKSAKKRIMVK